MNAVINKHFTQHLLASKYKSGRYCKLNINGIEVENLSQTTLTKLIATHMWRVVSHCERYHPIYFVTKFDIFKQSQTIFNIEMKQLANQTTYPSSTQWAAVRITSSRIREAPHVWYQ